MWEQFSRSRMLLGAPAMQALAEARVAVFGLGGVGGYALEALARSGVGSFLLVDGDVVSLSNLNRQILALLPEVGRPKTEAAARRLAAINPDCHVELRAEFFGPDNADSFDFAACDYVVDAIDSVRSKTELIVRAKQAGTPVISAMGAGNKLDPMGFCTADIYETKNCPLARVMRRELKKRGVADLKVVYSPEPPLIPREPAAEAESGAAGRTPGSVAFVPPVAGLLLAAEVVRDIISKRQNGRTGEEILRK